MIEHRNGIALVFARTETQGVQPAMRAADGVLFMEGRLTFEQPQRKTIGNAGGPSMMLAFGEQARQRLFAAEKIPGVWMLPILRPNYNPSMLSAP